MGKTRKLKPKSKKDNPVGIPSLKELEELEDSAFSDLNSTTPIEAIREQLESGVLEEKVNGFQSLAVLSEDKSKVEQICQTDIIRIAAPFLVDRNDSLRNACCGALRNISVSGIDVCELLVDKDVLTPLLTLMNEYALDLNWVPTFDETMNNQLDQKSDTFLQAVNLLLNLCESSSTAVDLFNHTQILQSFIRCLDYKVFGVDISISVAQCLLIISDNNSSSWNVLTNFVPQFVCLLGIQPDGFSEVFLKTLAAGILSNVPALSAAHLPQIFQVVSQALEYDHKKIVNDLTSRLPLLKEQEGNNGAIEVEDSINDVSMEEDNSEANQRRRRQDLPSALQLEIQNVEYILDAQKLAAEILSNLCSSDESEWLNEDGEDNDMSDEEEIIDENGEVDNEKIPVEIVEAIRSFSIVQKLYSKGKGLPENVQSILKESSGRIFRKVKQHRISILTALESFCLQLDSEDLGGPQAIYSIWYELGLEVFQTDANDDFMVAATGLMRAAIMHLKTNKDLFAQMSEGDVQMILEGIENCENASANANWMRMLGILGCLLSEPLVKKIIEFIVSSCQGELDMWTMSEALDSLMDMFNDNDWHQISKDLNLIQHCKKIDKIFKSRIREQKAILPDRYPACIAVKANFIRFVKYLENEQYKFNRA